MVTSVLEKDYSDQQYGEQSGGGHGGKLVGEHK